MRGETARQPLGLCRRRVYLTVAVQDFGSSGFLQYPLSVGRVWGRRLCWHRSPCGRRLRDAGGMWECEGGMEREESLGGKEDELMCN